MSQIHQLQVKFVALEDRALLRILTSERAEYRFWLTRRFVKVLWPLLTGLMQSDEQVRRQADAEARSAVVSFQHESAVSQGDFTRPFDEAAVTRPLGDTPMLLSHVRTGRRADGTAILAMHPREGQGIELALEGTLLHSLSKLIADAAATADWGLDMRVAQATSAAPRPERMN